MLETKRINSYGKRATRIVFVSNDHTPQASPFPPHRTLHENKKVSHSPASTRKRHLLRRKVNGLSTSPLGSPRSSNFISKTTLKSSYDAMTPRRPLVPRPGNVVDSPSIVYLGTTSPTKASRFTPFVDSEVVIMGSATRQDRKIKGNVVSDAMSGESDVVRPPRKRAQKRPVIVTDDEDEDDTRPLPRRAIGAQMKPIVIFDDSGDDYAAINPKTKTRAQRAPNQTLEGIQQPSEVLTQHPQEEISPTVTRIPPHINGLENTNPPATSPHSPPRRSQRNVLLPSKIQNQVQQTTLPFGPETYPPAVKLKHKRKPSGPTIKQSVSKPYYLAPLLGECGQKDPNCFSTFIETFPFDDIHGPRSPANLAFRKIGEASYSEVFAIGKVVLKIVPLRNESAVNAIVNPDLDLPQESDTRDVLQEVIVTRAMGQMCPGFIKLLGAYVVTGPYPSLLLSLWDEFHGNKGSENLRPDIFPPTQAYAVLVLPHGGPDLEAYVFPVKMGWRQACSIFWQTAKSLEVAEDLVSFEHRDLHWGQILVDGSSSMRKPASRTPARRIGQVDKICMDDPSHGVTATIIDLGLARMDARDGGHSNVHWTPFDELIFEGEGDYQFHIYRMMQRLHEDSWDQYRPLTNVMWLHYLVSKLLHAKRLRPPGKRRTSAEVGFGERQCYECLLDVEQRLGVCILQTKGKKGRGKNKFCNAGDVVDYARGRGWVL